MKNICIYGASSKELEKSFYEQGEELGKEMATRGYGMVFGAGAQGMMGAVARGVHQKNGTIVGVSPRFFDVDGVIFEHCTEMIFTHTMRERKQIMEERADSFITTPGGVGTFEEFFEILTLKQLQRHNKAMVVLNLNGYFDELINMLEKSVQKKFTTQYTRDLFFVAKDAKEALDYIDAYVPKAYSVEDLRYVSEFSIDKETL